MSAAELRHRRPAGPRPRVVVGSRTFGKGSVQMPRRLPDGSVAELTVGHYRTPSGHGVDGRGITPDLEADDGALGAETVLSGRADLSDAARILRNRLPFGPSGRAGSGAVECEEWRGRYGKARTGASSSRRTRRRGTTTTSSTSTRPVWC